MCTFRPRYTLIRVDQRPCISDMLFFLKPPGYTSVGFPCLLHNAPLSLFHRLETGHLLRCNRILRDSAKIESSGSLSILLLTTSDLIATVSVFHGDTSLCQDSWDGMMNRRACKLVSSSPTKEYQVD